MTGPIPTHAIPDGHSLRILMTVAPAAAFAVGIAAIASGSPFLILIAFAGVSAFTLALNWRATGRLSVLLAAAESEIRERSAAEARLRETSEILSAQLVDVTDRVRIEAELVQAQKMGAVVLLASGIAHDFNNTLTGARGFAELVRGSTTGRVRGDVLSLIDALDRGRLLTRRLLDVARRGEGGRRTVDVRQAVIGVEPLIRRLIGSTIEVELVLAREPLHANFQVDQLEQALINLAINARDAMPEGGRLRIAVGTVAIDHPAAGGTDSRTIVAVEADRFERADDVEIRVSDEGIGIPASILTSVFEPFFTTKPVGAGTGLGLAMVRGFVETAEGSLRVTSEVGVGTTFTIRLPRGRITGS